MKHIMTIISAALVVISRLTRALFALFSAPLGIWTLIMVSDIHFLSIK
jgi:hypothetical protein